MCIKFGVDMQLQTAFLVGCGVLDQLANGSSENDEACNVLLLPLHSDGVCLAESPPPPLIPLPHMFSVTACTEAANISCASNFLYGALEIYFRNLWENQNVPCWENCVYGSCRETSSSSPQQIFCFILLLFYLGAIL